MLLRKTVFESRHVIVTSFASRNVTYDHANPAHALRAICKISALRQPGDELACLVRFPLALL
jgi:hypothetical protein